MLSRFTKQEFIFKFIKCKICIHLIRCIKEENNKNANANNIPKSNVPYITCILCCMMVKTKCELSSLWFHFHPAQKKIRKVKMNELCFKSGWWCKNNFMKVLFEKQEEKNVVICVQRFIYI